MLDEVIALCHVPISGAFIANAHLPVSWQVSPLRTFQESIAVLITQDGGILVAQVNVLDTVPIDLAFERVAREQFCREFAFLRDRRYFSIRQGRHKRDYLFSPEIRFTKRFPTAAAYWDYLVEGKP